MILSELSQLHFLEKCAFRHSGDAEMLGGKRNKEEIASVVRSC